MSPASITIDERTIECCFPPSASSSALEQNALSHLSTSKVFLKEYRKICQQITAAREGILNEHSEKESTSQLHSLLKRQSGSLRLKIHALLDGKEHLPTDHYDDPAEKELWERFGHPTTIEHVKKIEWAIDGVWLRDTENSQKALRSLVKYLPEKE